VREKLKARWNAVRTLYNRVELWTFSRRFVLLMSVTIHNHVVVERVKSHGGVLQTVDIETVFFLLL